MLYQRFPIIIFIFLSCVLPVQSKPVEGVLASVDPESMKIWLNTGTAELGIVEASIGRGDAKVLRGGMAVRGDLVQVGGDWRLQTIWPNAVSDRGIITKLGERLRKDTLMRGSKVFRGVGEFMPKFALYNQNGELFLSESTKGRYVIVNFIFTRCTAQNMCPAATARMHELQKTAAEEGIDDLHLVSITLDPEYDTPGIFTAYAMDKGIQTDNFSFLSGPERIVGDLKKQLGVLSEPDEKEIIRHTMSTALVDPLGKIIYRIPGSMWNPETFIRQIKKDKDRSADRS